MDAVVGVITLSTRGDQTWCVSTMRYNQWAQVVTHRPGIVDRMVKLLGSSFAHR